MEAEMRRFIVWWIFWWPTNQVFWRWRRHWRWSDRIHAWADAWLWPEEEYGPS